MRKGQVYTMDLFAALSVFMLIMFMVMSFAGWLATMKEFNRQMFELERQVITAEDYITLGDEMSDEPYVLNKAAVDGLFAMSPADIIARFRFTATNYSMKLIRLNDSKPVLSSGYNSTASKSSVSIQRFAVYDNEIHALRLELWEPKDST